MVVTEYMYKYVMLDDDCDGVLFMMKVYLHEGRDEPS